MKTPGRRYFMIHKPYGCLSQFSGEAEDFTLADLDEFPRDVYPVGRLDKDSEGLLLLTNDKRLNNKLLNPRFAHEREYWVQVEGEAREQHLEALRAGVEIRVKKEVYRCRPLKASILEGHFLLERNPPIRFRKHIPTSWLSLCLTEGKNRQVRRMTAKVGLPTLRLFRYRIQDLVLPDGEPGLVKELSRKELEVRLKLKL